LEERLDGRSGKPFGRAVHRGASKKHEIGAKAAALCREQWSARRHPTTSKLGRHGHVGSRAVEAAHESRGRLRAEAMLDNAALKDLISTKW